MQINLSLFFCKKNVLYVILWICCHVICSPMVFAVNSINIDSQSYSFFYQQFWNSAQSDEFLLTFKSVVENHYIDINQKNRVGKTALHIAAEFGAKKIVSYLLSLKDSQCKQPNVRSNAYVSNSCKIDVNIQDYAGKTPLHYAIIEDHIEIIKSLLDAEAYLSLEDAHVMEFLAAESMILPSHSNDKTEKSTYDLLVNFCYEDDLLLESVIKDETSVNMQKDPSNHSLSDETNVDMLLESDDLEDKEFLDYINNIFLLDSTLETSFIEFK